MSHSLFIFYDQQFERPIHSEALPDDLEDELWDCIRERVVEAIDGEGVLKGVCSADPCWVAWDCVFRWQVTFVGVLSKGLGNGGDLQTYLAQVRDVYLGEVNDPQNPARQGVADVLLDVIPPWDDL